MEKDINRQEALIKEMEHDPVAFIEVFLDRELSSKQRQFLKHTRTARHVIAIWSRQTGKSTVIAAYIVWRLLYGKGVTIHGEHQAEAIAIVAPIKDQIVNLYKKIKTLIDRSDYISSFITKMNSEIITCKNGNEAKMMSASPGSQIRGYTATCIVIDESQDITDEKYSADILPFGATTNALIIEAGTPKTKNHFYTAIKAKGVVVVRQPWFECPFLSKEYVMGQRELSTEALWRQEYLCEFVEEGVLAFPSRYFEPEKVDGKLTGRWNLQDYEYISKREELTKAKVIEVTNLINEGAHFAAGLDLGRTNDNTVYTIWRTDLRPIRLLVKIIFPLGTDYVEIARSIAMFHRVYEPADFNVDYSNEKSFIEILQQNDIPVIVDQKKGRGALAFTNKNKNEMVTTAQILFENFQLQLPKADDSFISEFLNQQFEVINNVKKFFHPSNEHDDSLWSSLLALKNISYLTVDEITTFVNPWEKHDEKTGRGQKTSEVLVTNKDKRERNRSIYLPADMRRGRLRG